MKVEITQNDVHVAVTLEGRLDTVTSSEFEKNLNPYFNMEYISSAGLRVVLMAHKSITAKSGRFIIRNLSNEVRSVFDMTGFSRILTIE